MKSIKRVVRGYQPMGSKLITISSASWQFVLRWIFYQMSTKRLLPQKCIKSKHNQGDIFALQLRGHIAFA